MKNHDGKGGSYVRQADGSLKLSQRTEHPDTVYPVKEETAETAPTEQPETAPGSKGKGTK